MYNSEYPWKLEKWKESIGGSEKKEGLKEEADREYWYKVWKGNNLRR